MRRLVLPIGITLLLMASAALAAAGFVCAGHKASSSQLPPDIAAKPAGPPVVNLPATGKIDVLVIFAKFKDEAPTNLTPPDYAADLFATDLPGSFSHFYHTMSFAQFQIEGTVLPRRYSSESPATAYLAPVAGRQGQFGAFVLEILRRADQDIDFGLFDNDGPDGIPNSGDDNGSVDYVFINVLSTPHGFIKGGATGVAGLGFSIPYTSLDIGASGKPIRIQGSAKRGAFQQEGSFSQTVGSMAHEFGHSLNLPDLYDTEYADPAGDSAGIGRWGLMGWGAHGWNGDDGPNPLCAWSREELGWIGPGNQQLVELEGDVTGLLLEGVQQGGTVLKIPLGMKGDLWYSASEYLLLEQRTRDGSYYDRKLPAEGVLIWHTHPRIRTTSHTTYLSMPQNLNNDDEFYKGVDLICADGLYQDAGYPLGQRGDGLYGRDNLDFWAHDDVYALAHSGNKGDATDIFDGRRFARLNMATNPSSNPRGLIPSASTGLDLKLRRQEQAMVVDVEWPRWSGTIREHVQWIGSIVVDGDLRVAPEGNLTIHPGTQVYLSASDRLRSGLDPARVELHIQGGLQLGRDIRYQSMGTGGNVTYVKLLPEKVVFAPLQPDADWYGIILEPAQGKEVWISADTYELRHAQRGFVMPRVPADRLQEAMFWDHRLVDAAGFETAGNGDGKLDPGESFQFELTLTNGTMEPHTNIEVHLSWGTTLVSSTWEPHERGENFLITSDSFTIYPGGVHKLRLPSLRLSPRALSGQQVEFVLGVDKGERTWKDTLSYSIGGNPLPHEVEWAVPGHLIHDQVMVIPARQATAVQALVQGAVEAVDLVVLKELEPIAEIPMEPRPGKGEQQVFEAVVELPEGALHRFFLRLRRADGTTAFNQDPLFVWPVQEQANRTGLIFLGDQYDAERKESWRRLLRETLQDLGLRAHFVDVAPTQAAFYQTLLPHYTGADNLVIWLGSTLSETAQATLQAHLEAGGRLLLASSRLHQSPGVEPFLQEVLHARKPERGAAKTRKLRSPYLQSQTEFEVSCTAVEPLPPAGPALVETGSGESVGVRLDTGRYRAVYLPFDWPLAGGDPRQQLKSSLAFLHQQAVSRAELEAPEHEILNGIPAVWSNRGVPVHARVEGTVAAVELVVRTLPGLDPVAEISMDKVSEQNGEQIFATSFLPPEREHYRFFLRFKTEEGVSFVHAASLQVAALLLDAQAPVLVYLNADYTPRERKALRADLDEILRQQGLEASFLGWSPGDANLFLRYLGERELVVAIDHNPPTEVKNALAAYLQRGGRLLLISRDLLEDPSSHSPLRDMLHIAPAATAPPAQFSKALSSPDGLFKLDAFALYRALEIRDPAIAILSSQNGGTVGLQVNAAYRAVYLALKLKYMKDPAPRELLQRHLKILRQGLAPAALEKARLEIEDILEPENVLSVGRLAPRLLVANKGARDSAPFRLIYQIHRGGHLVVNGEFEGGALPAHAQRELALPPQDLDREGIYHLQIGLATEPAAAPVLQPGRSFHVVDLPPPFAQVDLGSEVSEGNGAGLFDYDSDGDLDVYLIRRGPENRLYRNQADGFREVAAAANLHVQGNGRGLAVGDCDGDGDLDLYLVNEEANQFFRNAGNGTFVEVSDELTAGADSLAPLADAGSGRSGGFFDADGDGDLDLYVVNAGGTNRFYSSEGGVYKEQGAAAGLADEGDGRGLAFADYDGDGDTDVLVTSTSGQSRLYRNQGGKFFDWTVAAGLVLSGGEVGAVFGDYDNDGDADLFIANERQQNQLYRNRDAVFSSAVTQMDSMDLGRQGVGAAFWDYDNDGDLDLLTTALRRGGRDELYQNMGHQLLGVGHLLDIQPQGQGRGLSFGDLDGDGDLDLFIADADSSRLYLNGLVRNQWLQVALQGPALNRDGLGSVVEVIVGQQRQRREVQPAFGYCSQRSALVQFGLGDAERVDTLRVRWPDGRQSQRLHLVAGERIELVHPDVTTSILHGAAALPARYRLLPNYPNPFNSTTIISYQLARPSQVRLTVYNTAGQVVKQLLHAFQQAGTHRVNWNGVDARGHSVGSGVFIYRLQADDFAAARRLVFLK